MRDFLKIVKSSFKKNIRTKNNNVEFLNKN